jgi:hypothetical protein
VSPRLLVVCIDGATPDGIRDHGLLRHGACSPLTSIYPSSTAPAHAAMLTGAPVSEHGVVGNRYWSADTDDVIARAHGDPLATLHPYERDALACPSLLDTLERAGLTYAALQFPHTFSRTRRGGAPAAYTLYAPTEDRDFALGDGELGAWPIRAFGEPASLALAVVDDVLHARCADPRVAIHRRGLRELDVVCLDPDRALSFALAIHHSDGARVVIRRKTATLVVCFGVSAAALCLSSLPHSAVIDYDADPEHAFYESPSVEWTTAAALALLATLPDVLFVRYNQVDHAQEYLHWLASRGDPKARAQVAATYARVDAGVMTLRERVGLDCPTIVFSDHGIDTVDVHLHVNALLRDSGLADQFVFQGDSSCAYLYPAHPDTRLSAAARAALVALVHARPELWIAGPDELAALGCRFPARQGVLTLRCHDHVELQYGPGPLHRSVRAASHGFAPEQPAMHGVFIPIHVPSLTPRPASITQLRALIESLLT